MSNARFWGLRWGIVEMDTIGEQLKHAMTRVRAIDLSVRLVIGMFALVFVLSFSRPVAAQYSGGYIPPFPTDDTYKLYVLGDSLGEGVWAGLYRNFRNDPQLQIIKKSRPGTGLARIKSFNWFAAADRFVQGKEFQVVVVMLGLSDRRSIWTKGKRHYFGSRGWMDIYSQRVERFIKVLKRDRAAVYWVGLPIMRQDKVSSGAQLMNTIFRERALRNGIKFIDTWNTFTDQNGQYSDYGPDLTGQMRRLRGDDGVHFTMRGYRRLAQLVEREIRRDLAVANAERDVPLAGDESEQSRVRQRARRQPVRAKTGRVAVRRDAGRTQPARKEDFGVFEYKAEDSTIELKVLDNNGQAQPKKVKILRPAIPAAVVAHIRRRSRSTRTANVGQDFRVDLASGQSIVNSITPLNDAAGPGGRRNVPVTQTPYYKVLVKGERLRPKPNRADDFRWPRPSNEPSG